jgi:hypothetical protein
VVRTRVKKARECKIPWKDGTLRWLPAIFVGRLIQFETLNAGEEVRE